MQSVHRCTRCSDKYKKSIVHVCFSLPGSGSQPPVSSPLDRVLKKAANKVKLAHSVSQNVQQQKPKEPTKRQAPRPAADRTTKEPARQPQPKHSIVVDDDALFNSITESERDSVWEAFKLEVEADTDSDANWLQDAEDSAVGRAALAPQRRSAPASARDGVPSRTLSQPVASSSGFKGFGTPPPQRPEPAPKAPASTASKTQQGPPPAASASARPSPATRTAQPSAARAPAATAGQQQRQPQEPVRKQPPGSLLRVFLFNAEEARTRALLQELGLAGRVEVVEDLRYADAVVAAKLARSGKHVNLAQGERTAANQGIPFIVVGRNMTADNLRDALLPLLDPAAAASRPTGAAVRAPTAAELQAHRLEVAHGFAQILKHGGVAPAAGAGTGTEAAVGNGAGAGV